MNTGGKLSVLYFYNEVFTICGSSTKGHLTWKHFKIFIALLTIWSICMEKKVETKTYKRMSSINPRLLKSPSSVYHCSQVNIFCHQPQPPAPRVKKRKPSSSRIIPSVDTSSLTCLVKLAYLVQEPDQDLLHWKKILDTGNVKVVFLIISNYWVLTINQALHQKLLGLFKFLSTTL